MQFTEFQQLFQQACTLNSIPQPSEDTLRRFHCFSLYLMEVNQITNLTAIRNIPDVITKHLVDCLLASEYIPTGATLLDLGCGPGFPSIPLAIARPDLAITALDSTSKKIDFVKQATQKLSLDNLTAISGRAEDRTLAAKLGKFDVVASRAVARLNVLCELCLPYVKVGGFLLAMKAAKGEEELNEATNAIKLLGGETSMVHAKQLVGYDRQSETRALIQIQKTKPTPGTYPRVYATILKKPL